MTNTPDGVRIGGWARNLEELDREVGRLAMLCHIRILEPGAIDRVLKNDRSVCGNDNPIAFAKLRDLLLMHFTLVGRWSGELGAGETAAIERYVLERLRKSLPELLADWHAP
ncbi:MAG TPA: hypothetical protein VMU47_12960 [Caldimonas sp.]|nr:hypothetical protein [Caldimonas sp.]